MHLLRFHCTGDVKRNTAGFRPVSVLLVAALLGTGFHLTGATYDALKQFSAATNTTKNIWQYGTSASPGGAFALFPLSGSAASPAYNWWSANGMFSGPVVGFNASGGTITLPGIPADIIWPDNVLVLAPGAPGAGTSDFATIRFVAPTAGTFNITGAFSDLQQSSVNVYIYVGGTQELSGSFTGASGHQGSIPFSLSNVALTAGEIVDFTVDSEGVDADDVLGLTATISGDCQVSVTRLSQGDRLWNPQIWPYLYARTILISLPLLNLVARLECGAAPLLRSQWH